MKIKNLLFSALFFCSLFSFITLNSQTISKNEQNPYGIPPGRTCGTEMPSQQWEEFLQKKVAEFLAANPDISQNAKQGGGNSTQAVYTIPVIIHVIHGGQAIGTFPNLAQGQLNSQIQVLNDDFAGVGQNVGNYPVNAFTAWVTNTTIAAASKDALGRLKIANTGVTFCLALQDSLGNVLAEPGIHRVDYNTLPALTGTFTSKNPANAVYNTNGKFQGFVNGYIKPNTIWNVRKYMNIWVTDENAALGLLGYATFPPLSTLPGIPGGVGTATTDGFWSWSRAFGSVTLFPAGTYAAGFDLGRTCTHEIGHWVGLRHIWGDGVCATDYCNDTPPASGSNFVNCPSTYPYKSGSCAGPPSNAPNGENFQNFMDYSYDCAMFMFTEDQRTRLQTAMLNSPYRNQLGTHGLCSVPPPVANFTIIPNPICAGQTATVTDMSTGSPGAWSYTMTGGSPSTSTLQSPTVTYTAAGVYSITLIASNGGGPSPPIVKTVTVTALSLTVTPPSATICAGSSLTLTASGATTYTWSTGANTSSVVVTPGGNITYTVNGTSAGCIGTKTVPVVVSGIPILTIVPNTSTICAGATQTLSGSGATNYTWMPGGQTTASIIVTPTATTIYTLTGSNSGTCVATRTAQIIVNTTPTVNVIASPTVICAGTSATLTASGATTYSWSTGATTSVIAVSPTITTNYTVTGANGSCTNTRTISLLVNAAPSLTITPATAVICLGNTATLTGSGATSYTWMPGSITTVSITASPTITTAYTLTGMNAAGCTSIRTTTVSVNPLPTLTITANPASICPGATSTLAAVGSGNPGPFTYTWSTGATTTVITTTITGVYTATVTNGAGCRGTRSFTLNASPGLTITANATPTSVCAGGSTTITATGATTYTWNTGPTTSSIVVSPSVTTTYTVNGTSGSCSGSNTISIAVNSNPTVSVVASPTVVCAGNSSTLTASGATTYSWNTSATTAAIVVTPTATTNYTVIGTNAAGCTNTRTVSLIVNPSPTVNVVSTPTAICAGSSATLSASGATTYSWNTGPTTSSIIVSPGVTTIYTVTGLNGICSNTQTISITVNALPTVTASSTATLICVGQSVTLTGSGTIVSYTWNTGPTTASISVSPTVTTSYTISGTDATGCMASAVITQSVSGCIGVNTISVVDITFGIYPNPNAGEFTITVAQITENTFVEIYNGIGQLVNKQMVKDNYTQVNLTEYADGIYHVRITKDGLPVYKAKVIKE